MARVFKDVQAVDDFLWDLVDMLEDLDDPAGNSMADSELFWRVNDSVYYYTKALKEVK